MLNPCLRSFCAERTINKSLCSQNLINESGAFFAGKPSQHLHVCVHTIQSPYNNDQETS